MPDILFIKTSSLGDVIHHMPALTEAQHAALMRARDQLMELVYVLPKEAEIARLKDELVQQDEDAKLKLVQLQRQLADARDVYSGVFSGRDYPPPYGHAVHGLRRRDVFDPGILQCLV